MSTYKNPAVAHTAQRNKRVNEATAAKATQRNQHWQPVDDCWITETLDIPVHEVALALGRTMYAVAKRRSVLLAGEPSHL